MSTGRPAFSRTRLPDGRGPCCTLAVGPAATPFARELLESHRNENSVGGAVSTQLESFCSETFLLPQRLLVERWGRKVR